MNENMFEQFLETPKDKKLKTVPRDMQIRKEGRAIVVPDNITYQAAGEALLKRAQADEEAMVRQEEFTCHPNDGYVAVTRLIEETFGFVQVKSELFNGAQTARIKTGLGINDYIEAICGGRLQIPGVPGIDIRIGGDVNAMRFVCHITAQEKHKAAVNAFLSELRRRIENNSIYHGKAFDSQFNFLDLEKADLSKVALAEVTEKQVIANIFTPLRHRNRLAEIGTPFGRSVLLEGEYGTGKTLVAFCAGKAAIENGITFIYVRAEDADKLPLYLRYARQYAPAVIFYEDIDLLMGTDDSERDEGINLVLNTLDGIDAKAGAAQEVMLVMTTNDVASINEALMRPGRIDAVIHIGLPDAVAAAKLISLYGGASLAADFDFNLAGAACAQMTPAFIREVVERAKLLALSRAPHEPTLEIEADDIVVAAQEIQDHLRLASPRVKTYTPGDRLAGALHEVVDTAMRSLVEPIHTWSQDEDMWSMPNPTDLPPAPSALPMPEVAGVHGH